MRPYGRGLCPAAYAPRGFQLADFIRLLDARRGLILTRDGWAPCCARWPWRWCCPPLYSSSATVMLDPRKNNITDLSAVSDAAGRRSGRGAEPDSDHHLARPGRHGGGPAEADERSRIQSRLAPPSLVDLVAICWPLLNPKNWFAAARRPTAALQRERVIDNLQPPCLGRCAGAFHHHHHHRHLARCGQGRADRQHAGRCLCEIADRQQGRTPPTPPPTG